MQITLVPSDTVPTEDKFDGQELVSLDTFLSAYALSEDAQLTVQSYLNSAHISFVQKRTESNLFSELSNKCLGRTEAWYSPIVTRDGWVYWVSGGLHRVVSEALAVLYTNGEYGDDDFILSEGIAWKITTTRPGIISHGRKYKPTREDKKIFEQFKVEIIDY